MSEQTYAERLDEQSVTSPFAPHTEEEVETMLETIGATDVDELFNIPASVEFDGHFGIESKSKQDVVQSLEGILAQNMDVTEFLGRGSYEHYVPSLVDHLSLRSEFVTSYTQYQPEIAQGFLQALFEYQSLLVELTGLAIANCSMYDAATALGEAATLASRIRQANGDRVLLPDIARQQRRDVLDNYVAGTDLSVESYPTTDGITHPETLEEHLDNDVVMVYVASPTAIGTVEEHLNEIGDLVDEYDALFCLGSDPVALSLFQPPAAIGADIVVGSADVLGLPAAYGTGLGLFACREEFLRQVPGRLVGASEDEDGNRAYTLTLQTREQHIRRERATSNICTNQAWVALRTAIHAASLGPSGLVNLAEQCVELPTTLATELDRIDGVSAPVYGRYHFREFCAETERPAEAVVEELETRGFAVHAVGDHTVQLCVTDANEHRMDDLVQAFEEVMG